MKVSRRERERRLLLRKKNREVLRKKAAENRRVLQRLEEFLQKYRTELLAAIPAGESVEVRGEWNFTGHRILPAENAPLLRYPLLGSILEASMIRVARQLCGNADLIRVEPPVPKSPIKISVRMVR